MISFLGITDPRTNSSKVPSSALPSARLVSTTVFSGNDAPLGNITNLIMQFGQFINHDLEFTAQYAACKSYIHILIQW